MREFPLNKKVFTPEQLEIAIEVAMQSKSVRKWVTAEAQFLGVNPYTSEGKEFYRRNARAAAKRLLA